MLPIEDALDIILGRLPLINAERVPLDEAYGRVLRENIVSDLDLPPFDRARMDGYAVRSIDTIDASDDNPVLLRAIGDAVAGHAFSGTVTSGTAVRIMTGAPLPEGADAVEKIEVVQVFDDGSVRLNQPVVSGRFITPCGSEARKGETLVNSGDRITPASAAALASFGYSHPLVSASPRIVLLSTGSELVEVAERPGPSQIRNSNTFSLTGYIRSVGARVVQSRIVIDDLTTTKAAIAEAADQADVVMLSGGVSMGDLDLVKPALKELGAEILVERVAMHPGKPTVFALLGDTVILGLPGNPVSVAVAFHIFARPVLLKMQGAQDTALPRFRAIVSEEVKGAPPRRSHQPARLALSSGQAFAEPLKWSGSSDLVAFMHANALIVVPEDRKRLEKGELAEVISLNS